MNECDEHLRTDLVFHSAFQVNIRLYFLIIYLYHVFAKRCMGVVCAKDLLCKVWYENNYL